MWQLLVRCDHHEGNEQERSGECEQWADAHLNHMGAQMRSQATADIAIVSCQHSQSIGTLARTLDRTCCVTCCSSLSITKHPSLDAYNWSAVTLKKTCATRGSEIFAHALCVHRKVRATQCATDYAQVVGESQYTKRWRPQWKSGDTANNATAVASILIAKHKNTE